MSAAKRVTIYTRGVTSPSGVGRYGVILLCDGRRKEMAGMAQGASNNRMDLLAAVKALRALKFPCQVTLYNTNTYLTDAISKGWAQRWRARGWQNSDKQPTPHADLWEELLELCAAHEVMFEYARFDPANPEYARCDALAHNAVDSEVDKADEELVPITREVIEAGRSERGGWNKEQLACLGVTWPPQRGWKDTVEGRFIKRADLNRFLLLKSEHGSSEVARGLFEYESNDDDSQQD